jgi:Protein of unknown function (DUF3309)
LKAFVIITPKTLDAFDPGQLCLIWDLVNFKRRRQCSVGPNIKGGNAMSLGLILVVILVIFLLGGFSGRFGGYGYGFGHGGIGIVGVILIIVVVLMLLGRL